METPKAFNPPPRLLRGPSDVAPSVLRAMSQPLVGHLDLVFVQMMEEIKAMFRQVFRTKNEMTFPVGGTGSAGMEFCCANLIELGAVNSVPCRAWLEIDLRDTFVNTRNAVLHRKAALRRDTPAL